MKPLIYLDTGALSRIIPFDFRTTAFQLAYSRATLLDLKNSSDASREMEYLGAQEGVFLEDDGFDVTASQRSPMEVFGQIDDSDVFAMGELYSFLSGGGSDKTGGEPLRNFIVGLGSKHLPPSALKRLGAQISKAPELKNRDVVRSLDRSHQEIRSMRPESILKFLENISKTSTERIEPSSTPPSFLEIQIAYLRLALSGLGPSDGQFKPSPGIRSRNDSRSNKVARHDYVDALHVAYGFHSQIFATCDKPLLRRAKALKDHWGLQVQLALGERVASH